MVVTLHDNSMSVRGTTVALYDYAYYLKHTYNYTCNILYNNTHPLNNKDVIGKFNKEFLTESYNNKDQIDSILSKNKSDYFFAIKGGRQDGVISTVCKNLIMAVGICSSSDAHGDKYAFCSDWLHRASGSFADVVPHMINLPDVSEDLRLELGIPSDAIVYGRSGGTETFDLFFVRDAIQEIVDLKSNLYFLFQNTDKFINHPRVIFLPPNPDMVYKVKFINTCDACLHARQVGESFGLVCGEFSARNKPVITFFNSPERNHIEVLGNKGIFYSNKEEIKNILLSFTPDKNVDWNCYRKYYSQPVMNKFVDFYLK
jgi:hypothetical protein